MNENAERQYVQSEPSAYWPDGSIKWTKHAAVFGGQEHQSFAVQKGESPQPTEVLRINESEHDIQVNTGTLVCAIHKTGSDFIQSLQINGKPIAAGGRLVAIRETRKETAAETVLFRETSVSLIKRAAIEKSGPVKAVIKIEGVHILQKTNEEWLPFVARLTFYTGLSEIGIVHTQLIDRNGKQEFIRGLGIVFDLFWKGSRTIAISVLRERKGCTKNQSSCLAHVNSMNGIRFIKNKLMVKRCFQVKSTRNGLRMAHRTRFGMMSSSCRIPAIITACQNGPEKIMRG